MPQARHLDRQLRILVGGGIGSGKSEVVRRFGDLGARVIIADEIGHLVLDDEALASVGTRWPDVVAEGRVDRGALARIVFSDPAELAALEALTHPRIIQRIVEIASGDGDLVVEIPLILSIPGGWHRIFIDTPRDVRARRAVARGGSEDDVRRRIANQPSRSEWRAWADVVIENTGSVEALHLSAESLWRGLRGPGDESGR